MSTLLSDDEIQALLHEFDESEQDNADSTGGSTRYFQYDFFKPVAKDPGLEAL